MYINVTQNDTLSIWPFLGFQLGDGGQKEKVGGGAELRGFQGSRVPWNPLSSTEVAWNPLGPQGKIAENPWNPLDSPLRGGGGRLYLLLKTSLLYILLAMHTVHTTHIQTDKLFQKLFLSYFFQKNFLLQLYKKYSFSLQNNYYTYMLKQ